MDNQTLPYFKKQTIIEQLIEELAEDGPKRPKDIKALESYGSKQDKYGLLKELSTKGIIKAKQISHKNKPYELCLDKKSKDLILEIKYFHQTYLKELSKKNIPVSEEFNSTFQIHALNIWQIRKVVELLQVVASYSSENPCVIEILSSFLHKRIDGLLELLKFEYQNNPEATDKAIEDIKIKLETDDSTKIP